MDATIYVCPLLVEPDDQRHMAPLLKEDGFNALFGLALRIRFGSTNAHTFWDRAGSGYIHLSEESHCEAENHGNGAGGKNVNQAEQGYGQQLWIKKSVSPEKTLRQMVFVAPCPLKGQ